LANPLKISFSNVLLYALHIILGRRYKWGITPEFARAYCLPKYLSLLSLHSPIKIKSGYFDQIFLVNLIKRGFG